MHVNVYILTACKVCLIRVLNFDNTVCILDFPGDPG